MAGVTGSDYYNLYYEWDTQDKEVVPSSTSSNNGGIPIFGAVTSKTDAIKPSISIESFSAADNLPTADLAAKADKVSNAAAIIVTSSTSSTKPNFNAKHNFSIPVMNWFSTLPINSENDKESLLEDLLERIYERLKELNPSGENVSNRYNDEDYPGHFTDNFMTFYMELSGIIVTHWEGNYLKLPINLSSLEMGGGMLTAWLHNIIMQYSKLLITNEQIYKNEDEMKANEDEMEAAVGISQISIEQ